MLLFIDLRWIPDELSVPSTIIAVVALLVGLGALVKAIYEIRTKGWQPFKERWVLTWLARRKLLESVKGFELTLAQIAAELRTNGGSSLKDLIITIDRRVEHIQARVRHQDETSRIAIFELDSNGDLKFANGAFREMVNADEQELTYRKYISRVHQDDRTRLLREVHEAIENAMPLDSMVKFRFDEKSFISVRLQATPDVRSGGELIGFFGTAARTDLGKCDPPPEDCPLA